jgi:hypothetical protein
MLKLFTGATLLLALASCNNSGDAGKSDTDTTTTKTGTVYNTLTDQEKTDGWQLLFDGQSLKGWHKYGGQPAGSAWKINAAEGAMYLDTTARDDSGRVAGGGDLVTDEEFENFHLKLEWKIAKNGNSGIMFYVHEDTAKYKRSYETGPEMQVLDNEGHYDSKISKHRAGDLYDLISCSKETVKPYDQWNQVEIKSLNGKLDFYLNGENVVSTTMWDDSWNKMIAASKFKQWPGFGTFKKGRICLQDHDNMVSFRNIVIKKL